MPMHFLGGVGTLLLLTYIFYTFIKVPVSLKLLSLLALGALLIGIGWEIFEYIMYTVFANQTFVLSDTLSDIFFDIIGAFVGILYIIHGNKV